MAAAADAMAVPPMPTKWTDLMADENISRKKVKHRCAQGRKFTPETFAAWRSREFA
jgi:hypothetical protein